MSPPTLGRDVPSVGRVVHYWYTDEDKAVGRYEREPENAPLYAPALITRVYQTPDMQVGVNLFVMRDLAVPFATENVPHGTRPGCWSWPARAVQEAVQGLGPMMQRAGSHGRQ
jgi:hypothetical protein